MDEENAVGGYKEKDEFSELKAEMASYGRENLRIVSSLSGTGHYEANKLLADPQGNFKSIVQLSHYYTDKIGVIKSAIKVYTTLTNGSIRLEGGLKKNQAFLEKFIKNTKLNKVVRQSIPDLYKAGNFMWYRERSGKESVWVHQLNPIDVDIQGHKRDRMVAKLKNQNDPATLPDDLQPNKSGEYILPLKQSYHCSLDREGYLRYGKPITTSTFEPVQHIQRLMDMETESIDSVIESLIIITLGDEKRPATPDQIRELKKHVKNLKSTSRLVGNHTLKADVIEKDLTVFDSGKFEVPMKMLLQSLGITPSIFTGEGSYATASAGMKSIKKMIEDVRTEIEETLEQLFADVAEEAGINPDKNPSVTLGNIDLTEEKIQHEIIRHLYLDGIISAETYALAHGHSLENEMERVKKEEKYEIEPRPMSSTLSGDNEDNGRPSDGGDPDASNPNKDAKPSNGT